MHQVLSWDLPVTLQTALNVHGGLSHTFENAGTKPAEAANQHKLQGQFELQGATGRTRGGMVSSVHQREGLRQVLDPAHGPGFGTC